MNAAQTCDHLHPHVTFDCKDCGVDTDSICEYYMVKDSLWKKAVKKDTEIILCIGCLEDRIGRELTPEDFTEAPVNTFSFFKRSARLKTRLGGISV